MQLLFCFCYCGASRAQRKEHSNGVSGFTGWCVIGAICLCAVVVVVATRGGVVVLQLLQGSNFI